MRWTKEMVDQMIIIGNIDIDQNGKPSYDQTTNYTNLARKLTKAFGVLITKNMIAGKINRLRGYTVQFPISNKLFPIKPHPRTTRTDAPGHDLASVPAVNHTTWRQSSKPLPPTIPHNQEFIKVPYKHKDYSPLQVIDFPKANECRWPFGDPKIKGFHFCKHQINEVGGNYCKDHAGMMFRIIDL